MKPTDFWVIIPARFASSRLPAKALALIDGQPMIQHVYLRACASDATRVLIATDDKRIQQAAQRFGAEVIMTASSHQSGTDRVSEAAQIAQATPQQIIVNQQGDEPLINPKLINQVAQALADSKADMATLCETVAEDQANNPNVVKVIRDQHDFALYFSRACLPFLRDKQQNRQTPLMRHIGLYAYRYHYLQQFVQYPMADLEKDEALEQLRALTQGGRILVKQAQHATGIGVDTAEDLAQVRHYFKENKNE